MDFIATWWKLRFPQLVFSGFECADHFADLNKMVQSVSDFIVPPLVPYSLPIETPLVSHCSTFGFAPLNDPVVYTESTFRFANKLLC